MTEDGILDEYDLAAVTGLIARLRRLEASYKSNPAGDRGRAAWTEISRIRRVLGASYRVRVSYSAGARVESLNGGGAA